MLSDQLLKVLSLATVAKTRQAIYWNSEGQRIIH